jgi:hypothetical protein
MQGGGGLEQVMLQQRRLCWQPTFRSKRVCAGKKTIEQYNSREDVIGKAALYGK